MSNAPPSLRRAVRHVVIVSGMVAAIMGAAYGGLQWRAGLQRKHWFASLQQIDARDLRRAFDSAGRYGPDGWRAAATLAASSDRAVSAEASALLLEWVEDRKSLPPLEHQRRLAAMAAACSASAPLAPDPARPWLRLLATRIAEAAQEGRGPAVAECLAHCHTVLRILPTRPRATVHQAARTQFVSPAGNMDKTVVVPDAGSDRAAAVRDVPPAAAGGLPLPPLATVVNEPGRINPTPSVAPRDAHESQPDAAPNGPLLPVPNRAAPRLIPTPRQPAPHAIGQPSAGKLMTHDEAHSDAIVASSVAFRGAEGLAPFAAQHADDPRQAAAAIDRLRAGGYSDYEIELGRIATSRDAALRRRLAETLPRLSGVDPRTWLMWLSYDEDAEVRQTTVTWMITTGEPTLLVRVRELAASDPEEAVRKTAQRAAAEPAQFK